MRMDTWKEGGKGVYGWWSSSLCYDEDTMHQLGLDITGKSMFNVRMANSTCVKCLGVIHDL